MPTNDQPIRIPGWGCDLGPISYIQKEQMLEGERDQDGPMRVRQECGQGVFNALLLNPTSPALLLLLFNIHVESCYHDVGLLCPQRYVYISLNNILVFHKSVLVSHAEIHSFGRGRKRDTIRNLFKKQTVKDGLFLEVKVDGISESQRTQKKEIKSLKWNEDLPL